MENPLVSVIMTAYNHEKYIEEAINSVLSQKTDFTYELLIGEDCSTDRTREIIIGYCKKYPDIIKVITSDENVGENQNYNRLINAARGKYIAHCEGDDYWISKNKLQKQIDIMESDPDITFCFHNVNFVYQNKNKVHRQFPWRFRDRYYSVKDMILNGGKFQKEVSMVLRRSTLNNPPAWYYEVPVIDWAASLLSGLNGKIYYFNDVMAVYRAGVSQSWTEKMCHNPDLYKEHLFKSMRARKIVDESSNHEYQKYFGRRIGRDIKWLIKFDKLSEDEFVELKQKYFYFLSSYDRAVILFMRKMNVGNFISFLRRIKRRITG